MGWRLERTQRGASGADDGLPDLLFQQQRRCAGLEARDRRGR